MKIVIVGGVAGGASAAARIRRLDEKAEIIIFEKTGHISYANCGLPYYIGGVIKQEEALELQTPESFWRRFQVDVRVNQEVTHIDANNKCVTVRTTDGKKVYEESYDKLLLAPGAKPVIPDIAGVKGENVFTLRSVEDTIQIKTFVDERSPKTATIIGGGFIGMEMAENLAHRGVKVTIIQHSDHILGILDYDMATYVHRYVKAQGITLKLNTSVKAIEHRDRACFIKTEQNEMIASDMVLISTGVMPDTSLIKDTGIQQGIKGSIVVNEHMATNIEDIYAVGDAVEVTHFVTKEKALISLAGPANKQGRIAADNMCGIKSSFHGSQASSVLKIFDITVAVTGIHEKQARKSGFDYEAVILTPMSHASYYPGGSPMLMKVLFEKQTQKLLGAQIIGFEGVDKRIDVLATAMRAGIKATELTELDLAYAPPYASAKDPVNMAGYMIENIVTGKVKQFFYQDIEALQKDEDAYLLDTRTAWEYARGFAEGFVNIPLDDLRERMAEIPKGKRIYAMCHSGLRSYLACRILSQNGYDCYNFAGGYAFYHMIEEDKK